jgi:hypothetical protein
VPSSCGRARSPRKMGRGHLPGRLRVCQAIYLTMPPLRYGLTRSTACHFFAASRSSPVHAAPRTDWKAGNGWWNIARVDASIATPISGISAVRLQALEGDFAHFCRWLFHPAGTRLMRNDEFCRSCVFPHERGALTTHRIQNQGNLPCLRKPNALGFPVCR